MVLAKSGAGCSAVLSSVQYESGFECAMLEYLRVIPFGFVC